MTRLSEKKKAVLESMMRESLFAAAKRLLEEEGWRGTTMERLAQEAGVSKGTIYNYFRDKRDILCFVMERHTEEIHRFVLAIDPDGGDPRQILQSVLTELFEGLHRNRRIIAATIQAYHEDADLRKDDFDPRCDPLADVRAFIRRVLGRGIREGVFRSVDPVLTEAAIHAVVIGLARQFSLDMLDVAAEGFAGSLRDLILEGLCPREALHP